MAAVANNPSFAKKAGVPQSVGKDFTAADKGIKIPKSGARADLQKINSPKTNQGRNELFKEGGSTMKDDIKQDKAMIKKAFKQHDMQEHKGGKGTNLKLAKGGKAKRFDEGGEVEIGDPNPAPKIESSELPPMSEEQPAAKPSSFKDAFAAARKGGEKTFEYNGKKYTTELASAPAKKAPTTSGPGRTTTPVRKLVQETMADRAEGYGKKRAAARAADTAASAAKESTAAETARLRQRNMPASKFDASKVDSKTLLPKKMAFGGSTGSFRSSANGIAQRGKTRGKMC